MYIDEYVQEDDEQDTFEVQIEQTKKKTDGGTFGNMRPAKIEVPKTEQQTAYHAGNHPVRLRFDPIQ